MRAVALCAAIVLALCLPGLHALRVPNPGEGALAVCSACIFSELFVTHQQSHNVKAPALLRLCKAAHQLKSAQLIQADRRTCVALRRFRALWSASSA
jgi:hypothetical protein